MYNEKEDPLELAKNYKAQGNVLLEKTNKTLKTTQDSLAKKKASKAISESEFQKEMKKLEAGFKEKLKEVLKYYTEGVEHGEKYLREYEERKDAFIKFKKTHSMSLAVNQMKERRKDVEELEDAEMEMTPEQKTKQLKDDEYMKRFGHFLPENRDKMLKHMETVARDFYLSDLEKDPIEQFEMFKDTMGALFNNRAQLYLTVQSYGSCISDCETVLNRFDPENTKACFRAAKSAVELHKHEEIVKFCVKGKANVEINFKKDTLHIQSDEAKQKMEQEKQKIVKMFDNMEITARERLKEIEDRARIERESRERIEKLHSKIEDTLTKGFNLKLEKHLKHKSSKNQNFVEISFSQVEKMIPEDLKSSYGIQINQKKKALSMFAVFLYDEFGQSEMVQSFEENVKFQDQMEGMFPLPFVPQENIEKFDKLSKMKLYYLNFKKLAEEDEKEFIEVEDFQTKTLKDVIHEKDFYVPSNYVLVFHLVSKDFDGQIL